MRNSSCFKAFYGYLTAKTAKYETMLAKANCYAKEKQPFFFAEKIK